MRTLERKHEAMLEEVVREGDEVKKAQRDEVTRAERDKEELLLQVKGLPRTRPHTLVA
jgi:hypothetical protein